ncbi:MAG: flagellar filament capping protein FliD [Nocardioides sp.]
MANASVSGLVSGLDTASIINQLIQLESRPQSMLKTRMSTEQREVTALQTLNAKIAGVATKAADLAKVAAWSPLKATSDNDKVSVKADTTAAPGTLSFSVTQTATASRTYFATAVAPTDTATTSTSITVTAAATGAVTTINLSDTSLQGVADALNDPANNTGVQATLVRAGGTDTDPTYQLHVVSTATGASSGFTVDLGPGSLLGTAVTANDGKDAALTVNGASITSSTNTITDLMPGVDVTLAAGATGAATITVARDTASLSDRVKALVDAANQALSEIDSLSAASADAKSRGMLAGDATLRSARNQLLDTVTRGIGGESLAQYGVSTDRSGKIVFDEATFKAAYEADPAKTTAMFAGTAAWRDGTTGTDTGAVTFTGASWRTAAGPHTVDTTAGTIDGSAATVSGSVMTGRSGTGADGLSLSFTGSVSGTVTYTQGFAAALEAVAQRISNADTGTITSTINGRNSAIDRMEDDIADWDVRLDQRRTMLERQYGALEVALGKLQNQSTWLAGQISSLPKMMGS